MNNIDTRGAGSTPGAVLDYPVPVCRCGAAIVLDHGRYELAHADDCEAGS